jgi:hypothetical protein
VTAREKVHGLQWANVLHWANVLRGRMLRPKIDGEIALAHLAIDFCWAMAHGDGAISENGNVGLSRLRVAVDLALGQHGQ